MKEVGDDGRPIMHVDLRIESARIGIANARSRHASPSFLMSSSVISAADVVRSNDVQMENSKLLATAMHILLLISHMLQLP